MSHVVRKPVLSSSHAEPSVKLWLCLILLLHVEANIKTKKSYLNV